MDLTAKPYRIFLKIAELGSFRRAAEALHMTQPALSFQLRALESRLGFKLLDRSSRRVALSAEGRLFIPNARRMVLEAEWAIQAAREIRQKPLRIAVAHHTQLIELRTRLTDSFMREYPDIPLRIRGRHPSQLGDEFAAGLIDIAITLEAKGVEGESAVDRHPEQLAHHVLAERPLQLALRAGHPWAALDVIDTDTLQGQQILCLRRDHGISIAELTARSFSNAGATAIRAPEGDALSTLRYASLTGIPCVDLGWFPFPPPACTAERLVSRPVDWDVATRLVVLSRPEQPNPFTATFLSHAADFQSR